MKFVKAGKGKFTAPAVVMGCMRIADMEKKQLSALIQTALDQGVNFFDHADIYGGGRCEEVFGQAINLKSSVRDKLIIQSKCGIRKGMYDFSKEHILEAVDGTLKRLNTEYLDVLLLHRPDTLVEPEEVAEAFSLLHSSGKVRHFGVSNQNPMQMELLAKYLSQPILFNQLQLSITNCGMIDQGLNVNMQIDASLDRDGGVLDYCRLKDITIQAWSPFQYGFFEGVFLGNEKFKELNQVIDRVAAAKGVTPTTIAAAWILRHPANMQVIAGTTNPARLKEICGASDVELTRQEWYEIYLAVGKKLP